MNPESQSQPTQNNNTTQPPAEVPTPPAPQPQAPTPPAHNEFADKAFTKVKIGAIILIASSVMGLLLVPASYSYTEQTTDLSAEALFALYAVSVIVQIVLIILGARLFKREWAFAMLSSLKLRILNLLPIVISFLFVTQWNKFANIIALALLLYATVNLKKAGIITNYKQ